jgi:predicted small secreted protein
MKAFKGVVMAVLMVALMSVCALGCNTIRGAGKDIEQGGRSIQNAADSVRGR